MKYRQKTLFMAHECHFFHAARVIHMMTYTCVIIQPCIICYGILDRTFKITTFTMQCPHNGRIIDHCHNFIDTSKELKLLDTSSLAIETIVDEHKKMISRKISLSFDYFQKDYTYIRFTLVSHSFSLVSRSQCPQKFFSFGNGLYI